MKKILILTIITCFLLGGCSQKKEQNLERDVVDSYSIEYQYWDETTKTLQNIPDFMWKPKGIYPNVYKEKTKEPVDGLRHFRKDEDTIYAFEGWYYDVAYTNMLTDNMVAATVRDDITLYAKIVEREKREDDVVTASITYVWNDFGVLKEGISSFPEMIIQGLVLPKEYEEGKSISLPKLNTWEQSKKVIYEFEGWYYDEELKNRVVGEIIPGAQTGHITIYAAFIIWAG